MIFHNPLRQTLPVNKYVRDRALKNRNSATPAQCGSVKRSGNYRGLIRSDNLQQTVGKCVRVQDPKEFYGLGFGRDLELECPVATPVKFFWLPLFNSQCEFVTGVWPRKNEDTAGFQFVDLKR